MDSSVPFSHWLNLSAQHRLPSELCFSLAEFICTASPAIRVLFLIGWIYLHSIACHQSSVSHWLNLSAQHRLPSEFCFSICTASFAIRVLFLIGWIYLHSIACNQSSVSHWLNLSAQHRLPSESCFTLAEFICTVSPAISHWIEVYRFLIGWISPASSVPFFNWSVFAEFICTASLAIGVYTISIFRLPLASNGLFLIGWIFLALYCYNCVF